MLEAYRQHVAERAALGIPPLPLDAVQTAAVIELLKAPPAGEEAFLVGAHALLQCNGLITRDEGFFRDYFKGLKVIVPKT